MFCNNNVMMCLPPTTGTAPQTFSAALQFFAAATCLIPDKWLPDAHVSDCEKFDFIIVGAGTSGCVVANRLSENKNWKILIIEAGLDPPIESKIPAHDRDMYDTKYDWRYRTTFNGITNNANKNKQINWIRGKMLGGCSSINTMAYIKGNREDYQRWYDAGNKEWHPDEVIKYFEKVESLQNRELLNLPEVRKGYGLNGPVAIQKFNSTYRPLTEQILGAYHELGMKNVPDLNTANVFGSGILTVTAFDGTRASSDRAYLLPIQNRPNLKILKGTLVTEILINKITKMAYGVKVDQSGRTMKFLASREVILCAGAINTPQLLLLSGIGPREHLKDKNIPCIADLPVGRNLQDHFSIFVPIFGDGPSEKKQSEKYFDAINYLHNRTGELAHTGYADIVAFYSRYKNATYPEFQIHLGIFRKRSSGIESSFGKIFNYEDSIVQHLVELNKHYTLYNFIFNLLHPHSLGNITLNTTDPKDPPIIYANYFDDLRDLEATIAGLQQISKIRYTKFFRSNNGFLGRMYWPRCNKYNLDSYKYWHCVCLDTVSTIYHPVGTAKMGPDPANSVVDGRLRVHKVKSLRVIDASIMPNLVSGNTNGPCFMIGERGSDLIKEDYAKKSS